MWPFGRKKDLYDRIKRQHRVIRVKVYQLSGLITSDRSEFFSKFSELQDFIVMVHSRLEEEVVFKELLAILEKPAKTASVDSGSAKRELARLEADHAMLQKLGNEIKSIGLSTNDKTLLSRFETYRRVLLYHDNSEESAIDRILTDAKVGFPDNPELQDKVDRVIASYGLENYNKFIRS